MEGCIMKRSIISLLTIVSLSLASVQAMEKPNTVLSVERALGFTPEAHSKTIQDCSNETDKRFDLTALRNTIKIFLTNNSKQKNLIDIKKQEHIIDIVSDTFMLANFSSAKNKYDIANVIADCLHEQLTKNGVFDVDLLKKLYYIFDELRAPLFIGSLILTCFRNNYCLNTAIPNDQYFLDTYWQYFKAFFKLPKSSNEKRKELIVSMIKCLKKNIAINTKNFENTSRIFARFPEGIAKMILRFIYPVQHDRICVFKCKIKLKENKDLVDLSNCFTGSETTFLIKHLETIVLIAKHIYGCNSTRLNLSHNNLGYNSLFPLALKQISNLRNLISLNISSNNFRTYKVFSALMKQIASLTKLAELDLSKNYLGTDYKLHTTLQYFGKLTKLTSLNLSRNDLGTNDQLLTIMQQICKLTNLTNLNLSWNHFAFHKKLPAAMEHLNSHTKLTNLNLSYNSLGNHDQLLTIFKQIGKIKSLTSLNLKKNSLGSHDQISAAMGSIATLIGLKNLDASRNGLSNNDIPQALRNQLGNNLYI